MTPRVTAADRVLHGHGKQHHRHAHVRRPGCRSGEFHTGRQLPPATVDGTPTRFGRQFSHYAEFFSGKLADIRIYDHAPTSGEIAATPATPEPWTLLAISAAAALEFPVRRSQQRFV